VFPILLELDLFGLLRDPFALHTYGVLIAAGLVLAIALAKHACGRLGCLAAGCCFGEPSEVPWAIAFPAGSMA
jgi:phosphatidylglycerol---prolipoprotein diacylglyceryl transferase